LLIKFAIFIANYISVFYFRQIRFSCTKPSKAQHPS